MSTNEREKKIKDLWILQLRLNKYVGETEVEIDPKLDEIMQIVQPPEWFNSGVVFTPLSLAMANQMHALEEINIQQREELSEQYQIYQTQMKENESKQEKEIVEIYKEIDSLNEELKNLKTVDSELAFQAQNTTYLDSQINRQRNEIARLQKGNQDTADTITEYIDEMEILTNEYVANCDALKKNRIQNTKYKQQITESINLTKQIQKSNEQLIDSEGKLRSSVDSLLSIKKDNDKTINQLEDEKKEFELISEQFQNIQQSIQTSQSKQGEILEEMIKSIELAENISSDIQMYQAEIEMQETEAVRLQTLIREVTKNFDAMVEEYDNKFKKFYRSFQSQIDYGIDAFTAEKCKLTQKHAEVEQKLNEFKKNISPNDNNEPNNQAKKEELYKPSVMDTLNESDFSIANSANYLLKMKEEIERIISEKEKMMKMMSSLEMKTLENNDKLIAPCYDQRKKISKLRSKGQKLVIDLSLLRGNLKSLLQKNGTISDDNERLKCYINKIRKTSVFALSQTLQTKDDEIRKIQATIQEEKAEHDQVMNDIQNELAKYQLVVEKFTNDKKEKEYAKMVKAKEQNDQNQVYKKQINSLKGVIQNNFNELSRGQIILKNTIDQIENLKSGIAKLLKKEKHQESLMNNSQSEQIALHIDIERYQRLINNLDKELDDEKKKYVTKSNDIEYEISEQEQLPDPL